MPTLSKLQTAERMQAAQAAAVDFSIPLQQRMSMLLAAENDSLMQTELDKSHPITTDKFTADELAALKAHLFDGGGVQDDTQLCIDFATALHDEDWDAVLNLIPHIIKCWLKQKGIVVPMKDGGGIITNGAGPTGTPILSQPGNVIPGE